jgi:hypothetical protein
VWGFTNPISPLGPVSELPSFHEVAIGPDVSEFDFPDGDWFIPGEEDEENNLIKAEFEGDAADYLEQAIEEGQEGIEFEDIADAAVNPDETRLIERDGKTFGGTVLEPTEALAETDEAPTPVVAVMEYDPGNPLFKAKAIFLGALVLLLIHLFFLGRAERTVKARPGAEVA